MAIKKNDFVEIEFTGKSNNLVFDTTNKEEAKSIGLDVEVKPLIVSVGNQMLVKGFDEILEGKEINKKYSIHLTPDKAFGKRQPGLVKILPIKVFHQQNMNPVPGMTVQLDNYIAKVLSVSGGRVSVDFNNPLAGKDVDYDFTIKRIVEDNTEKVNALQDFFFKMRFDFEIKDKKVIFKKPEIRPFVDVFKPRFKEITGLDFEVVEEKKEGNQKNNIQEK
jgi:FKBP-type peptidyl-prolyl cis-trans isomerase 2